MKLTSEKGLTLLEVLIALTIFSATAAVLITTISYNLYSSILSKQDLKMHNLAEHKMNEVKVAPKEFTDATNNSEETGTFEIEGFKEYKYVVKIRRMELPNLAEILGQGEEESRVENQQRAMQRMIYDKIKLNLEEMVWQINVTVISPDGEQTYELNSWIEKTNAKIDTNFGF